MSNNLPCVRPGRSSVGPIWVDCRYVDLPSHELWVIQAISTPFSVVFAIVLLHKYFAEPPGLYSQSTLIAFYANIYGYFDFPQVLVLFLLPLFVYLALEFLLSILSCVFSGIEIHLCKCDRLGGVGDLMACLRSMRLSQLRRRILSAFYSILSCS